VRDEVANEVKAEIEASRNDFAARLKKLNERSRRAAQGG
jgi:hypothetical protein